MTKNDEFVILVEQLYWDLGAIYESGLKNNEKIASKMIFDFYKQYEERFGITLQDVEKELDKIRAKYGHESKEEQER